MQNFLRLPGINFMPLMAASLDQRIHANQSSPERFAWLESLGLVHGDLRPANILLDQHDHIKLSDFDSVAKMGSNNPGNVAPWVRLRIELYEDKGPEALDLLEDSVFPEPGDSPLDKLTVTCWMGGFATLADLAMATGQLVGAQGAKGATAFDDEYVSKMKAQCQELLEGKLAGIQFDTSSAEAETKVSETAKQ